MSADGRTGRKFATPKILSASTPCGNAKIQKFKCDILGNFQTIWERVVGWSRVSFYKPELMKSVELCCTELWPKTAENAVFWQIDGLKSASFFTPRRLRLNWILFHTQVFKVTTLACTIVYAAKQVIVRFLLISRFFFLGPKSRLAYITWNDAEPEDLMLWSVWKNRELREFRHHWGGGCRNILHHHLNETSPKTRREESMRNWDLSSPSSSCRPFPTLNGLANCKNLVCESCQMPNPNQDRQVVWWVFDISRESRSLDTS